MATQSDQEPGSFLRRDCKRESSSPPPATKKSGLARGSGALSGRDRSRCSMEPKMLSGYMTSDLDGSGAHCPLTNFLFDLLD